MAGVERSTRSDSLTDLSASRISTASKCGLAFHYQYVEKLPSPVESAARLFGTVIHDAVQEWYGEGVTTTDNANRHKDLDLALLVKEQWKVQLPKEVWTRLGKLLEADEEQKAVEAAIMLERPSLKKPRSTKAFLSSSAAKHFSDAQKELREYTEESAEIKWPKNGDAYIDYLKSLELAKTIEAEWKPLPRPILVEEPFRLEFEGFVVRGRIDQVRQDVDLKTGEAKEPVILDIKTSKQPLTQMEAFVQAFLYYEAVRQMDIAPTTDNVAFYLARQTNEMGGVKIQKGKIEGERHKALALRILQSTGDKILKGDDSPHYGHWCRMCDWHSLCAREISLWEGDGFE